MGSGRFRAPCVRIVSSSRTSAFALHGVLYHNSGAIHDLDLMQFGRIYIGPAIESGAETTVSASAFTGPSAVVSVLPPLCHITEMS